MISISFGEYLPDLPKLGNPGLTKAENVYPGPNGYGPFSGITDTGDTFSETCLGTRQFFRNDGTVIIVVGGETKLGVSSSGGVTETTGYTSVSTENRWRFERFGDYVIAVSPSNSPQYLSDIDTVETFTNLPGSPPTAQVVGRVGDHLVLGNLSGYPNRVQWSNFNDPTGAWDTDVGDLSGYFDLNPSYGDVTGIFRSVGGSGVIFQERAIWLMTFVGAPLGFDFTEVSTEVGCPAPDSIVSVGSLIYFLSQDGFYVTNGSGTDRIGANRVDDTFLGNVNATYRNLTQGAVNWSKNCIVWSYIAGENPTGYADQIIFSYALNRWSTARQSKLGFVSLKQGDITIGDLDSLYANIGSIDVALGTQEWVGSDRLFGAWYDDGGTTRLGSFSGNNLEATFETGLMQATPGYRTTVRSVTPLVENVSANTTAQIISQDTLTNVEKVSTATTVGVNGCSPQKTNGRYLGVRVKIPSGSSWDKASGLIVDARVGGRR